MAEVEQVDIEPVEAANHRQTGDTAFGSLRL